MSHRTWLTLVLSGIILSATLVFQNCGKSLPAEVNQSQQSSNQGTFEAVSPSSTVQINSTVQLIVSGGVSPYTFAMETQGASVDNNGLVTAGAAVGAVSVRVTDKNGLVARVALNVVAANAGPPPPTSAPPTSTPRPVVTAGSITYSTPGTYTFAVPNHNRIIVKVWGAGGGGGGSGPSASSGGAGANSAFGSMYAQGGGGGPGGYSSFVVGGVAGNSFGGDTNYTGNTANSANYDGSNGGPGAFGGNGGAGGTSVYGAGSPGNAPGGGGGGGGGLSGAQAAGGGGAGGAHTIKTFNAGAIGVGTSVSVTVGGGGAGGAAENSSGGAGANGRVEITWQ
jgi:hypothetical protein